MKDYKEMSENVLKRVHEYEQRNAGENARVKKAGKISIVVLPLLTVAAIVVTLLTKGAGGSEIKTAGSAESSSNRAAESSSQAQTSTSKTESSSAITNTAESNAVNPNERVGGQPMIAALPKNNRKQVIGEQITEQEARDHLFENAPSLQSSLLASGVELAEISYETAEFDFTSNVLCARGSLMFMKGYCHVSYDGNTDESKPGLTIKQNFMDFHVYNAGRLVAIVTLVKENGLIYSTPAFAAPWFDSFNSALNKYQGRKVLFLYAGTMAYAVAPDNTVIHPQGHESSVKDSGLTNVKDAYSWFYDERCVYTP